jgi:hypothetical protein
VDIIFSINNNESVIVLPIPCEVQLENPYEHSTFDGLKGPLTLLGQKGLRSFPIQSYFPIRESPLIRPGATADAWSYVDWFETNRARGLPMRVIIIYDSGRKENFACAVKDFTYWVERNGDVGYSMTVTEYPIAQPKPADEAEKEETEELTEEEEEMKWAEFEKSEEYALLKRLTRRAKADSASTDGFTTDLEKAIAAGITTGDYPQDVATREQVASMIVRAHNL